MGESLAARAVRLQREIRDHKSAIKRHREGLGRAKSELVALEAEGRQHGILLIVHPSTGEGGLHHGRDDNPRS